MFTNLYYGAVNQQPGRKPGRGSRRSLVLPVLSLGALILIAGCQTRPRGPGTAVRTPAFSNNGAETLFMRPPPKPEVVIGLPNRPGQPATVTTVLTPAQPIGTGSPTPAYPPLPTTTSIHEEILAPSTGPAALPPATAPATRPSAATQPAVNAATTKK